jgi:hypothetical protein
MADLARRDGDSHKKTSEPPRLHIVHHETSPIRHTGIGEYQVTMSLRVEMLNAQKEMVHVQFLVDGVAQKDPQLLGDDGWCEETLTLKPNTQPHLQVLLRWRHDPTPAPSDLDHVQVPVYVDPREQYFFQRMAIKAERRRAEQRSWWWRVRDGLTGRTRGRSALMKAKPIVELKVEPIVEQKSEKLWITEASFLVPLAIFIAYLLCISQLAGYYN